MESHASKQHYAIAAVIATDVLLCIVLSYAPRVPYGMTNKLANKFSIFLLYLFVCWKKNGRIGLFVFNQENWNWA